MSDIVRKPCSCRVDRQVPPGAGIFLASLIGFGGCALALIVLSVTGSWFWTLLTWLLASPIGLAGFTALHAVREHLARGACLDARCRFRDLVHPFGRTLNV